MAIEGHLKPWPGQQGLRLRHLAAHEILPHGPAPSAQLCPSITVLEAPATIAFSSQLAYHALHLQLRLGRRFSCSSLAGRASPHSPAISGQGLQAVVGASFLLAAPRRLSLLQHSPNLNLQGQALLDDSLPALFQRSHGHS
eukprot:CAMPEP_0170648492 /NCGR_PEP_ID=MMETSP0224-20130122/44765_1 /TAXON_ID=285029 /ORGANISM="Togula jolla, Strain CCCM 725" /LENGTH=140 /DNA_ID=CAMNT_0010980025 /DNA_START=129 /DNA_END=551 /DNA_ORIENTATION=-